MGAQVFTVSEDLEEAVAEKFGDGPGLSSGMEWKPFLILRSNLSLSFASIKSGLVQTETTSGFGHRRRKRLAHSNRGETATHASSESHISGESIGSGVTQTTRQFGQCNMAK